jgi:TRAP-type C4-dicarboxylate transport system permease small subunit
MTVFLNCLSWINRWLRNIFVIVSGSLLVLMMLLTCANIFMRIVAVPIRGTFELMGLFGAVVACLALAHAQIRKDHICVDILVERFPKKIKLILAVINDLACIAFALIVTWQIAKVAINLCTSGEVTETLRIVSYPFTFAVALGFLALTLVFVEDICNRVFVKGDQK